MLTQDKPYQGPDKPHPLGETGGCCTRPPVLALDLGAK